MHAMNTERPDLNLLIVFNAVASTQSVTAAAKLLSLSQPAVSHALNRLRDILDDPLFVRSKAGFLPTPRAKALTGQVRENCECGSICLRDRKIRPGKNRKTILYRRKRLF